MQLATSLRFLRPIAAALLAISSPAAAGPLVVQLPSIRDNTMFENAGDLSNGAGQFLFAGQTLEEFRRRCLLEFDLSPIPSTAVIVDVQVTLHVSKSISGALPMTLHHVLSDWGEAGSNSGDPGGLGAPAQPGDVTWTHAFWPGTAWTAGGDYVAAPSATEDVAFNGFYTWQGAGLVTDVQAWVSGGSLNHGWILLGDQPVGGAKRFDSREHERPGLRPVLTVTYEAPVPVETESWGQQKAAYR